MKLIFMRIILAVTSSATTCYKIKQTNGDRIVNGTDATRGQFPFIVSLSIIYPEEIFSFCGGSIIRRYWTLTAAHCIDVVNEILIKYNDIKVLGNSHIVNNSIQHDIDCYKIHSMYQVGSLVNDIALIRVKQPFEGDYEKIISRPPRNFKYVSDSEVTAMGWGVVSYQGPLPKVLQYVGLQLIDDDICRRITDYHSGVFINLDVMVCAGENSKTSCNGDSGGPLIQRLRHQYQIGIASWGTNCMAFPGVYVRITTYLDWIENITKQYNSGCQSTSKCIPSRRNT
ncbi:hypothetical protein ILUMI_24694 [Ignelater luminosus]|uniref:Peptidase S1 domain-containing protein n=1 Tax=Ignelater luminosus TaxID=2038154 RepID=A0A8K0G0E0_IGNLU|nr:hypothetical protein ILUMI_24694 [Ignelater luminosus]